MDFHLMACEMAGECFRCSGENSLPIDSKLKVAFAEQLEVLLERIYNLEKSGEDAEQPTTGRIVKFKFARMDRVVNDFDEEGIVGSLSENPEGNNVYYVHYSGGKADWICEERLKLHVNCSNQEKKR